MASKDDNGFFSEALALPVSDRARLAHELLRSLDESDNSDAAEAWNEEIERRAREVREGHVHLEDWTSVHQRLHNRWNKR